MAKKILLPVVASERFEDAVVASGDLIAEQGGTITFLFTSIRPPPFWIEKQPSQTESLAELAEREEGDALEDWQEAMIAGLNDARDLLYERGVDDEQLNYVFADFEQPPARAIADEAAAGAYDLVVLSRGEFIELPDTPGQAPEDIARAVQELAEDGVHLLVT